MRLHQLLVAVTAVTCALYLGNALAETRCRTTSSGLTHCLDRAENLAGYKRWRDNGPTIKKQRETTGILGYRRRRGEIDVVPRQRSDNFGYFRHRN